MADPISSPDQDTLTSLLFKASHDIALAESEGGIQSAVAGVLRRTDFITSLLMVDHENIYFVSFYDPQIGEIPLYEKDSFPTLETAKIFNSAEPVILTEVPPSPSLTYDLVTPFFKLGAQSVALIPAFSSQTFLGLVLLASRSSDNLTQQELLPYIDLAEIMANSIARLKILNTTQTRLDGLHRSLSVTLNVFFETDLEPLYQIIHNQVRKLFGKVDFLIAIYHPETELIEIPYAYEQDTKLSLPALPLGEGLTSLLIKNRKPMMIVEDSINQAKAYGARFIGEPAKSWMGVPLIVGDLVIGAMIVEDLVHERRFNENDLDFLMTLSPQIAAAIRNAQMMTEIQKSLKAYDEERYLLSALMESIPDKVYFKDNASRFIRANRAMLSLFNTDKMSDLVGKSDFDFFTSEHASQAFNDEQGIIRSGKAMEGKLERETWPDRPDTWVLSTKAPLRDPAGNIMGVLGISREVTELVQIREMAERRAQQVTTAAEIARDVSSALKTEELLNRVVNLVRARFGYYHASIFLVDPAGEYAVLRESTGEAGRQMKDAGHKLAVGSKSIVGRTTATGEPLVINDVTLEPSDLPNPLLPGTRAECAVPLKIGDRVLGALDVQSTQSGAFLPEDVKILQILADQLSSAIVNSELLAETQANLSRLNALMDNINDRVYFKDLDSRFIMVNKAMLPVYHLDKITDLIGKSDFDFYSSEHASQAYNDEQEIIRTEQPKLDKLERETYTDRPDTWALSSKAPLRDADGKVIGIVGISRDVTDLVQVRQMAERRAQQLTTAAEIARDVSSALQPEELLRRVVNLVRDRFGFYHASVFLLDPAGEYAELRESTGEAGRQMKEAGHKLAVGSKSTVGQATVTGLPLVINDVTLDPTHRPNPLLPDTRAECAIPLQIGTRILGAMDVQSNQPNAFSPDDVNILQTLADQLSTAIANAELLAETQENLGRLNALMDNINERVYFKDREGRFILVNKAMLPVYHLDKMSDLIGKSDFDFYSHEFASNAFNDEQTIMRTGEPRMDKLERESYPDRPDTWALSSKAPLHDANGNVVGILGISRDISELVQVQETAQRRAQQLTTAAEIARDVSSALEPEELLRRVVNLVRDRFGFYHASIFLVEPTGEYALLRESTGEAGRQMKEAGHKLAVGSKSTVGQATATGKSLVINDVTLDPTHRPNPLLPDTRAECAIPLQIGARILGALDVQSNRPNAFSPDDINILQTLADQVSTAIANAELLAETQANLTLLSSMMDNITDVIYFKDRNSRFIRVNCPMLALFNTDKMSDLAGKSDFDFFEKEHAEQAFNDEQEIIRTGTPIIDKLEKETWPDRPDTWVLTTKAPMRDPAGNIVGLFGISRQVTELVRVREAAQRSAQQLMTAAEIARDISSALKPEELLALVVNLVRERFGFYHASIFLIDPASEYAVLRESTGEAGRQMKQAGHKLAVGSKSIIGQTTATGISLVVNDVTDDPTHLPNPLLPDTRAELGIPLKIGSRVLGALDVQSTQPNAFSPDDVNILQTLADQLSTAIINAELLAETQENLARINAMMDNIPERVYFKDRNSRFILINRAMLATFKTDKMSDILGKSDFDFYGDEHASQAFNDEQEIMRTGQPMVNKLERETYPDRPDTWSLSTKAALRDADGNIVGTLGISGDVTELVQVREMAQRRAQQLLTSSEIARDVSSALQPEEILGRVVNLVRDRFGFYQVSVFLIDPSGEYALMRESTGEAGRQLKKAGHKLGVGSKSIVGQVTATGKSLVINDVTLDPTYFPNPLLPDTRAELAIPLSIGERILGAMDVQSTQTNAFSPDDVSTLQMLADQLSTAIANSELFAETQKNLAQQRLLYQVTTSAASITNLDDALINVVEGLRVIMEGIRIAFLLYNQATNEFEVKASAGYANEEEIKRFKTRAGVGVTGIAARDHQVVYLSDVTKDPRYVALDKEVMSELAIPLIFRNEVLGVLNLESPTPYAFTEGDQDVLATLASSVAVDIANARLLSQIRQQVESQRQLFEATSKIRRSVELKTILETSASEIGKILGAQRIQIEITPPGSVQKGEKPVIPGGNGKEANQ